MNSIRNILTFLLLCFGSTYSLGASSENNKNLPYKTTPLTYGQQYTVESKILGKQQIMNIYLPADFHLSSAHHTYPVIFINDTHGSMFFHALTGIVKHLSEVERMPKSIVVSLNSGGHIPDIFVNGMWDNREKIDQYGQPAQYQRHLKEEVFPFLAKKFRANGHHTIIGVSGSTLFPMSSLINSPNTFDAYILLAASDMIGMGLKNGHSFVEGIIDTNQSISSRKRYLYVADAESAFKFNSAYKENLTTLSNGLSPLKSANFDFDVEIFENEDHYAVFLKNILAAFENMYPQNIWEPKYRDLIKQPGDAMKNIDAFYHNLSAKYDFDIIPMADRWNNVNNLRFTANSLIQDGRNKEAVTVAQRWSDYRPQSLLAVFTLAQALEKSGLVERALKKYQLLITMATIQKSERIEDYKNALEALKKHKKGQEQIAL